MLQVKETDIALEQTKSSQAIAMQTTVQNIETDKKDKKDQTVVQLAAVMQSLKQETTAAKSDTETSTGTSATGTGTKLPPNIQNDLKAWEQAEKELSEDYAEIIELVKELKTAQGKSKGSNGLSGNTMILLQRIMQKENDIGGAKIKAFAAVDQVDTDMRNALGGAQGAYNGILGHKYGTPWKPGEGPPEAQKMIDLIDGIDNFLKQQKAAGGGIFGKGGISSINNLLTQISNIKSAFGKDWGNKDAMAKDIIRWKAETTGGQDSGGGPNSGPPSATPPPQLKQIQDAFQTINQSVSALSTAANTELQYQTEQIKQFLGIYESVNQAYLKATGSMVNNQRSN